MEKLKPGTKVRITGNSNYHGFKIGDICKLKELHSPIPLEKNGRNYFAYISEGGWVLRDYDFEVLSKTKQTFKVDMCVATPSKEIKESLYKYAKSKGVPVYVDAMCAEYFEDYRNIVFSGTGNELCGNCSKLDDKTKTWITIEQFIEYCDNWEECRPKTLKLTDDYTAKLDFQNNIVEVGCQKIDFEKVLQLAEMIKMKK